MSGNARSHVTGKSARPPRGMILLVMLSMLALFTLLTITFVVAAGNFRKGAIAAHRVEQMGDPPSLLLNRALLQVVRGSRNPMSKVGPHSLLEDMYGHADSITGMIAPAPFAPTGVAASSINNNNLHANAAEGPVAFNGNFLAFCGVSFGPDRQPGVAFFDDNGDGVVDDPGEFGAGDDVWLGNVRSPINNSVVIDNVDDYYAGRVITFTSGVAAGQSTFIVRSRPKRDPDSGAVVGPTELWCNPLESKAWPVVGDRFIINGRAFQGSGFGYNPDPVNGTPATGLLNLLESSILPPTGLDASDPVLSGLQGELFMALLPDPTERAYQRYLTMQHGRAVSANEDYDAADYQNLMLAHRVWDPVSKSWETIAPSLHRPDLINYWLNRCRQAGMMSPTDAWSDLKFYRLRRKVMLRPDPQDHFDPAQEIVRNGIWDSGEPYVDLNKNGQWDPGEPFTDENNNTFYDPPDPSFANYDFHAINGPWDVDNDNDGAMDSVWMDFGFPIMQTPDGRQVKVLVAVLCIDMDGRVNFNAHGSQQHYFYGPSVNDPTTAWAPIIVDRAILGTNEYFWQRTSHSANATLRTSREHPFGPYAGWYGTTIAQQRAQMCPLVGQGYSPADINLARIADIPSGSTPPDTVATTAAGWQINRYRWTLEGRWFDMPLVNAVSTSAGVGNRARLANRDRHLAPLAGRYGEVQLNRPSSYGIGPYPAPGMTHVPNFTAASTGRIDFNGDDNDPAAPSFRARGPGLLFRGKGGRETFAAMVEPGSSSDFRTGGSMVDVMRAQSTLLTSARAIGDYGTPSDFHGRGTVGLDYTGQPIYHKMGYVDLNVRDASGNVTTYRMPESIDDPTEINLFQTGNIGSFHYGADGIPGTADDFIYANRTTDLDAPYTPYELESFLRAHDPDAWQAQWRFRYIVDDVLTSDRHRITTESWDVPIPHIAPTPEMRSKLVQLGLPVFHITIHDLIRAKIGLELDAAGQPGGSDLAGTIDPLVRRIVEYGPNRLATMAQTLGPVTPGVSPTIVSRYNTRLFSPDLLMGLRMDINAPFGNGFDDNGNGVVDEPLEHPGVATAANVTATNTQERVWIGAGYKPEEASAMAASANVGLRTDLNRDGMINLADRMSRQELAKQLYVLMMLLKDTNYRHPVLRLPDNATNREELERLTARRIAQWAVNVADFRDRDSIMTPFEYDIRPFRVDDPGSGGVYGTWEVDGNPATVEGPTTGTGIYRGVVWGCEYPDLLLTETLAFHDRRVQNTNSDASGQYYEQGSMQHMDPDWDQPRIPQGSCFIELYCTGNRNNPALNRDLYHFDPATKEYALDLAKMAPNGFPVWRLAVTARHDQGFGAAGNVNNVAQRFRTDPDRANFEPGNNDSLIGNPDATKNVLIDRIVVFNKAVTPTLFNPEFGAGAYSVFRHEDGLTTASNVRVKPGHYAVVGPYRRDQRSNAAAARHNVTKIGRTLNTDNPNLPPASIDLGMMNAAGDTLRPFEVRDIRGQQYAAYQLNTPDNLQSGYQKIKPVVGIPCAGQAAGFPATYRVGFNVSEPPLFSYYTTPPTATTTDPRDGIVTLDRYTPAQSSPFDNNNPELTGGPQPLMRQTRLNYKTVLLQRLADPTLRWNPLPGEPGHISNQPVNPYITIDWMPLDLTIFNGEPDDPGAPSIYTATGAPSNAADPDDPVNRAEVLPATRQLRFGSRQRGTPRQRATGTTPDQFILPAGDLVMNLWGIPDYLLNSTTSNETQPPVSRPYPRTDPSDGSGGDPANDMTANKFRHPLNHTLGLVNQPFQIIAGTNVAHSNSIYLSGTGWVDNNHPYIVGNGIDPTYPDYLGSPRRPFQWLTWNDRPFANHMELMLVPAASPTRLLWEMGAGGLSGAGGTLVPAAGMRAPLNAAFTALPNNDFSNHYRDFESNAPAAATPVYHRGPPFRHLLNFFHSSVFTDSGAIDTARPAPNYYRLFEFVHVPSRYSGTHRLLFGPSAANNLFEVTSATAIAGTWPFVAPFNRVSSYREPGKVNINTISDAGAQIWAAIVNDSFDWDYYRTGNTKVIPTNAGGAGAARTTERAWYDIAASREAIDPRGPNRLWGPNIFAPDQFHNAQGTVYSKAISSAEQTGDDLIGRIYSERFDPRQPAVYSNPFRAFSASYTVPTPIQRLRRADANYDPGTNEPYDVSQPANYTPLYMVDGTLLRRRETSLSHYNPPANAPRWEHPSWNPLLAVDYGRFRNYGTPAQGIITGTTINNDTRFDFRNTDRNPMFRYQMYTKTGGNLTVRSNVYAIWVTIGYFEVDRVDIRGNFDMLQRYPDGFRLVRELGSEFGEVKRHRAFALFDRSIPVAFERGENHNVEKGFLVKRIIE